MSMTPTYGCTCGSSATCPLHPSSAILLRMTPDREAAIRRERNWLGPSAAYGRDVSTLLDEIDALRAELAEAKRQRDEARESSDNGIESRRIFEASLDAQRAISLVLARQLTSSRAEAAEKEGTIAVMRHALERIRARVVLVSPYYELVAEALDLNSTGSDFLARLKAAEEKSDADTARYLELVSIYEQQERDMRALAEALKAAHAWITSHMALYDPPILRKVLAPMEAALSAPSVQAALTTSGGR